MKKSTHSVMQNHRKIIKRGLGRRYRSEKIFRMTGFVALAFAFCFLFFLLASLTWRAMPSFYQSQITLPLHYDKAVLDPDNILDDDSIILEGDMASVIAKGLYDVLDINQPLNFELQDELLLLVSSDSVFEVGRHLYKKRDLLYGSEDRKVLASSLADDYMKGDSDIDHQYKNWLEILKNKKLISKDFNYRFFTNGDSQRPETAGIFNGVIGSLFTIAICFLFSFPLAIMAGIYLEEFFDAKHAHRSLRRFFDIVEVNINSLAAVPSIIYGLLGLSILVNFIGVPRSSALAGGLTLGIMTMPLLIIVTRASLRAVPQTIREAALSLGINRWQLVWHHLLPLSLPGILTGTILGLSRALGETAPLILIGMVAFVMSSASGITSPTTTLPVQVFLWASHTDSGFVYKTAAAIIVLLFLLFAVNLAVILMRQKWTKQW
ncbi:MAG: phosphate ABC transporter permease PstA [Alphaproteobacteria bacterium]